MISIIAAVAQNGVIGDGKRMPWHLPTDLKHFKALTSGHPVIMGRKTFESLGKPLPNRRNVVITRDLKYQAEGIDVAHSLMDAIRISSSSLTHNEDVFVIGGGEIYRQAMSIAEKLHITRIHGDFEGGTLFPVIDTDRFKIIYRSPVMEENGICFEFIDYECI